MKPQIKLSIALGMSLILLSLISSETRVLGQNQRRVVADTGVVTLGPNQVIRISVVSVDGELGGGIYGEIRSRQINYSQEVCNGSVCKSAITSQSVSGPISLMSGEAVSFRVGPDIQGNGVRSILVFSNRRNVRVNMMIIDTITGNVVSFRTEDATPFSEN